MSRIGNAALAAALALGWIPAQAEEAMTMPPMAESEVFAHAWFDQFEGRFGGDASFRWDGQAWLGTDEDKLWLKTEGFATGSGRGDGRIEDGDHELLYDRAVTTYFDLQAGLRSDLDFRAGRNWAAFGVQGLAPLFFDVAATGYVSGEGHLAMRLQASYDLLLTQRLILQPEAELNLYSKADPARLVGSGIADIDTGLRLRYEIDRKFAPYLGIAYRGSFGQTADFTRAAGESSGEARFVLGIRWWL